MNIKEQKQQVHKAPAENDCTAKQSGWTLFINQPKQQVHKTPAENDSIAKQTQRTLTNRSNRYAKSLWFHCEICALLWGLNPWLLCLCDVKTKVRSFSVRKKWGFFSRFVKDEEWIPVRASPAFLMEPPRQSRMTEKVMKGLRVHASFWQAVICVESWMVWPPPVDCEDAGRVRRGGSLTVSRIKSPRTTPGIPDM